MPATSVGAQVMYNALVGGAQVAASRYYGLLTGAPSSTGGTSGFNEISGGGYARVARAAADMDATGGSGDNDAAIEWTNITTEPKRVGIFDKATGGNLLAYSDADFTIAGFSSGQTVRVPAGSFDVVVPLT